MTDADEEAGPRGRGRVRATSKGQLERVGLDLFIDRGFSAVTVDDIAEAAGIGRRTFFRYFDSKNDVAWGDFSHLMEGFAAALDRAPAEASIISAVRDAVRGFNDVPVEELSRHRHRMRILLTTPELVAHSTVRYADWRAVIAEFVAQRLGLTPQDALPQAVSWACLGISLSAYEQWIDRPEADLLDLIDASFLGLRDVFAASMIEGEERP